MIYISRGTPNTYWAQSHFIDCVSTTYTFFILMSIVITVTLATLAIPRSPNLYLPPWIRKLLLSYNKCNCILSARLFVYGYPASLVTISLLCYSELWRHFRPYLSEISLTQTLNGYVRWLNETGICMNSFLYRALTESNNRTKYEWLNYVVTLT
jgi:hypothetical protein